jgi:hypothetical protein
MSTVTKYCKQMISQPSHLHPPLPLPLQFHAFMFLTILFFSCIFGDKKKSFFEFHILGAIPHEDTYQELKIILRLHTSRLSSPSSPKRNH